MARKQRPDADSGDAAVAATEDATTQDATTDAAVATTAAAQDDSMADVLRALVATPGGGGPSLKAGAIAGGQYRIERRIGSGGMGVVYLAHDLRLDRDVALKVGQALSADALRRVEREAIALARLSHPNVVVIHDVGELDGRVFLAMEFVEGGNAREWLAARPRSWREIVALFVAAGDGLAAAHAAGLVHRDFKPDNVLVGADGTAAGRRLRPGPRDRRRRRRRRRWRHAARRAVVRRVCSRSPRPARSLGTPAYMAPEQIAGGEVDARADQFAFCVALWEALFTRRPFPGRTPAELAEAIESRDPEVPAERRVPRHVQVALRRGLAHDRDARWPAMPPLLAALRRDPSARRRRVVGALAVGIAAAAITIPIATRAAHHDPCSARDARLAAIWNPDRAAAIAASFERIGAGKAWTSLQPIVDRYARRWAVAHQGACRATRVDGSQSEATMERRMLCLVGARAHLGAVVTSLVGGGKAAIAHAGDAVSLLPDLERCSDVASLDRQSPLPDDPARRRAVEDATAAVDAFDDHTLFARADLIKRADQVIATARAAGWPPLVARATRLHAKVLGDLGRYDDAVAGLETAADQAVAASDDDGAAWAMADLAMTYASGGDAHAAAPWLHLAQSFAARLGDRPALGCRIATADAERARSAGDAAAALAATRVMIELSRKAYPQNRFDEAENHRALAVALLGTGRLDDAAREAATATRTAEAAGGPDHPAVARCLELEVKIAIQQGRVDDAGASARRALAIAKKWYGAGDPRVAPELNLIATVDLQLGDFDGARAMLSRAIALEQRGGTDADTIATQQANLAIAEAQSGHLTDAVTHGKEALAVLERVSGHDNPYLNPVLVTLGICERNLHHLADSRGYLERAVKVAEHAPGAPPVVVNPRIELSYTLVALHRPADAIAVLAPAIAHIAARAGDVPPPAAAECHVAYAKALWAAGRDPARARAEAAAGRDAYAALGKPYAGQRAEAAALLRAHGGGSR